MYKKTNNVVLFLAAILFPIQAFAAKKGSLLACIPSDEPITDPNQLTTCIESAMGIVQLAGGIGFFAMGLWGGVMWATSGGNEDRITKGRQILTAAIVGFMIVVFSPLIVNLIIQAGTGG